MTPTPQAHEGGMNPEQVKRLEELCEKYAGDNGGLGINYVEQTEMLQALLPLLAKIGALRKGLEKYGQHTRLCDWGGEECKCTCGFTAALDKES